MYMYVCVLGTVGSYDITVHTWRPSGHRVVDKMRRFFVGGAPRIDDVSYIATPRDFQVSCVSMEACVYMQAYVYISLNSPSCLHVALILKPFPRV